MGNSSLAKTAEAETVIVAAPDLKRAVEAWLTYLEVERQLSANTSEAYARDISQFLTFLAGHLNRLPTLAQLKALAARDVRAFLASRRAQGVGSRSLSRTLSALRMFFRFLERRGLGKNDAVRAVALPKLPHSVPKPLTAVKARALVESADIAAPDAAEWITARDTAVLALLYGSGLRISEALSLARKDAPIQGRDMLRVTGKGDKTRVVPVLPIVREAVERYLELCPIELGSDDPLFVGVRGRPALATHHPARHRAGARRAWAARHGDAACAAAFLRHASARRRRGFTRNPGAAGPRQPLDHARLYRGRPRAPAEDLRPRPPQGLSSDRPPPIVVIAGLVPPTRAELDRTSQLSLGQARQSNGVTSELIGCPDSPV